MNLHLDINQDVNQDHPLNGWYSNNKFNNLNPYSRVIASLITNLIGSAGFTIWLRSPTICIFY